MRLTDKQKKSFIAAIHQAGNDPQQLDNLCFEQLGKSTKEFGEIGVVAHGLLIIARKLLATE